MAAVLGEASVTRLNIHPAKLREAAAAELAEAPAAWDGQVARSLACANVGSEKSSARFLAVCSWTLRALESVPQ